MNEHTRRYGARPRTRAQERIDALGREPVPPRGPQPPLRGPQEPPAQPEPDPRLGDLERELAEAKAGWQRTAADYANYRRRTEQEREASLGLANEALLRKLLAVVDDFDRALAAMPNESEHLAWVEGISLVERKLRALLESEGVTPIAAAGKPFDPHEHEAVVHLETADAPDETVIDELQKGYRIRDRVLRPSLVAVAKNTDTNPNANTSNNGRPAASGEEQ